MQTNLRNIKKKDSFSKIAFMNTYSILISSMSLLSLTCNMLGKGLSSDIPDLSTQALESLVAHYVDSVPPGDGSSNRDNGVRADIAFKTIIPLSDSDKLELFNKFPPQRAIYDDNSEACYYVHPVRIIIK